MNPNDPSAVTQAQGVRPSKTFDKVEKQTPQDPNMLSVEVRNPDKILFKGSAIAISSRNEVGPFDVLPQHENFISIVSGNIIVWTGKHQKQEIESTSAIMKAKSNTVRVFLGVESLNKDEVIPQNPGLKRPLQPKPEAKTLSK